VLSFCLISSFGADGGGLEDALKAKLNLFDCGPVGGGRVGGGIACSSGFFVLVSST
jgi:hypothetical protein